PLDLSSWRSRRDNRCPVPDGAYYSAPARIVQVRSSRANKSIGALRSHFGRVATPRGNRAAKPMARAVCGLVKRHEALRHSVNVFKKHLVTCYLGSAAEELYASGDEPRFFYVLGSMGVASSVGLGVALASGHAVLAFEGD